MDNPVVEFVTSFGIAGLGVVLVVALAVALFVHWSAEPGKQVSLLWGLASYQKRIPIRKARTTRPIEITHEQSETLWRIMHPVGSWVDSDLTKAGPTYLDSLLAGPHHVTCKGDLSIWDGISGYEVRNRCPSCDATILPIGKTFERLQFKVFLLNELQRHHLAGGKIVTGMKL